MAFEDIVGLNWARQGHKGGTTTYQPFPDGELSGTLAQVVEKILKFPSTKQGMAYLGSIRGECTPFGYGNVECTVTFMVDGIAVISVSSSNMYPYHWEYNTASRNYTWKAYACGPISKPDDFESSTYIIKYINGIPTWVKEQP